MHAIAVPPARATHPRRPFRPPHPSTRRLVAVVVALVALLALGTMVSTLTYLRLPTTTGELAVGRNDVLLVDPSRVEPRSATGDSRAVRLVTWYPAEAGTGTRAEYVPGFDTIRDGLVASGELDPLVVASLPLVGTDARSNARPLAAPRGSPVVLLSPGNATNVAFYASLAEDLASHGYVVVGIDHPYQVAAVDLGGGELATYEGDDAGGIGGVADRIDERLADVSFVLDRLAEIGVPGAPGLAPDLGRVSVVGHSNGGLTAAQACVHEPRVAACVNIDGQQVGGPFSARPDPAPIAKPFLFLTKESELHPKLAELFEASGHAARVVIPVATHGQFTDGARFEPRVAPVDGTAEAVLTIERGFVRAFLDHWLRGESGPIFDGLEAPADVYVEVYPLGGRDALPVVDR